MNRTRVSCTPCLLVFLYMTVKTKNSVPHAPFLRNMLIMNREVRGTPLKKVAPWVPLFVPLPFFSVHFCVNKAMP